MVSEAAAALQPALAQRLRSHRRHFRWPTPWRRANAAPPALSAARLRFAPQRLPPRRLHTAGTGAGAAGS